MDIIFDRLPGALSFNSIKSRCVEMVAETEKAKVASLEDIIKSKEASGRPKDLIHLVLLREGLKVKEALEGYHLKATPTKP